MRYYNYYYYNTKVKNFIGENRKQLLFKNITKVTALNLSCSKLSNKMVNFSF